MARPQQFDRTDVINAAIDVFHRQGYAATSVPDLVKATGLQPGSLYAAFGNKKGILMEALETYSQETKAMISQCFSEQESAIEGIRKFFFQAGQRCSVKEGSHGCFMVNSLLEMDSEDRELADHLNKLLSKFENLFRKQLQKAQDSGEIGSQQNLDALSKYLVCSLWGLQVLAKTEPEAQVTQMVVDQIVSHLNQCA